MIELVLAFQDKDGHYTEHAGVALASVFHNTNSPINVHILHDESLNEVNKRKLIALTTRYKHTINFHLVTIPESMLQAMANINSINVWTQACMYRLLLPALIPVEKIIYLDCDILVNMDIAELWQTELNDHYLGAIWDQGIMEVGHIIGAIGLSPERYFNSGVILFGLNNIRNNPAWYDETLNFLQTFPNTTMPDQDTLNAVYGGNYLPLDIRFNFFNMSSTDNDFNNKIVHFAGTEKCWDKDSSGFRLYKRYRKFTPWGRIVTHLKRKKRNGSRIKLRVIRSRRRRKLILKMNQKKRFRISLSKMSFIKQIRRSKAIVTRSKRRVTKSSVGRRQAL